MILGKELTDDKEVALFKQYSVMKVDGAYFNPKWGYLGYQHDGKFDVIDFEQILSYRIEGIVIETNATSPNNITERKRYENPTLIITMLLLPDSIKLSLEQGKFNAKSEQERRLLKKLQRLKPILEQMEQTNEPGRLVYQLQQAAERERRRPQPQPRRKSQVRTKAELTPRTHPVTSENQSTVKKPMDFATWWEHVWQPMAFAVVIGTATGIIVINGVGVVVIFILLGLAFDYLRIGIVSLSFYFSLVLDFITYGIYWIIYKLIHRKTD